MTERAPVADDAIAEDVARLIRNALGRFHDTFRGIARGAGQRFARRDWRGLHDDARQRLDVRESVVQQLLDEIRGVPGIEIDSQQSWVAIKAAYAEMIEQRDDWEIAQTFFNSVTRRVFVTVGVDSQIEFDFIRTPPPPMPARDAIFRTYAASTFAGLIRRVLADQATLYDSEAVLERDAERVAARITTELTVPDNDSVAVRAEFAKVVFYRGDRAYLIGRTQQGSATVPLVLCLTNDEQGPHVDAVLMQENDVSLLFSFTRSYFLVEVQRPYDVVAFINTLIPKKRVAEIYISLGYTRHGKTELYRNARRNIDRTDDKYELAEGQRGMVMIVFTRPSFPVVLKVIRDHFEFPKECTRASVIDRYHLIFNHDRAGRLVDAQEYEHLVMGRSRFQPSLLDELAGMASETVSIEGDRVIIKHCFAERRIVPLDVYVRREPLERAKRAIIDYGNAIRDLALTNLFPGDLLTKNFGVTRGGRVVFYDYDEVCLVTECNFRAIPDSGNYDDDLAAEPWYGVGPQDVFPEEFINFLGLSKDLREVFLQHHAELLTADFWNNIKAGIADGELYHVAPYADDNRLR